MARTAPTKVQQATALLTPRLASLRPALAKLLGTDGDARERGLDALQTQMDDRKVSEADARALLALATQVTFPLVYDEDPAHELVFALVENPYPALVAPLRAAYPTAPEAVKRVALAAFGAIGTRAAAEGVVACVREHGWPKGVYGRVFTELAKLQKFGAVLFPDLLLHAGKYVGEVAALLGGALASGTLDPSRVDLASLAPLALAALPPALARAHAAQAEGTRWRFRERYDDLRVTTGAWLTLAAYLPGAKIVPLLARAVSLRDPKLAALAARALLQHGRAVPAAVFERVAADHETRALLFENLESLRALAKFPKQWRTWEAFAAAEMARWLLHPAELGYLPARIELMQTLVHRKHTLYVWKFLDGKTWKAGISGPYVLKGTPRPSWGASTFSQFERADAKTAEQHAATMLKTLASWTKR